MSDIPDSDNEEDFVEVPGLDKKLVRLTAQLDRTYEKTGSLDAALAALDQNDDDFPDLDEAIAALNDTIPDTSPTTTGKLSSGILIIAVINGTLAYHSNGEQLVARTEICRVLQKLDPSEAVLGVISSWDSRTTQVALEMTELVPGQSPAAESHLDFAFTRRDFPAGNPDFILDVYLDAIEKGKKFFTKPDAISAVIIMTAHNLTHIRTAARLRDNKADKDGIHEKIFLIGLPRKGQNMAIIREFCDEVIRPDSDVITKLSTAIYTAPSIVALRHSETQFTKRASALRHVLAGTPPLPEF